MKGIKILLESLGIKINPSEIEDAWSKSKDALPRLAAAFDELNARLARIEEKLGIEVKKNAPAIMDAPKSPVQ